MGEFGDKMHDMSKPRPETALGSEAYNYLYIRCSTCPYREVCPSYDPSNGGCGFRKTLYDRLFAPIEFKTDDAIAVNRLRLTSYYFTELMLMRTMGARLTPDEIGLLRIALDQLGKLYIDKKGDLLDQKSKVAVPWEKDENVENLKKEVDEARKIKAEYEKFKATAKKKVETDGG